VGPSERDRSPRAGVVEPPELPPDSGASGRVSLAHEGQKASRDGRSALVALLALINVPFWLHDPGGFSPPEGVNRVTRFNDLLPFAGVLLPALAAGIAIAMGIPRRAGSFIGLAGASGAYEAFLVTRGLVLASLIAGKFDSSYAYYGRYFLFVCSFACWALLDRRSRPMASSPERSGATT